MAEAHSFPVAEVRTAVGAAFDVLDVLLALPWSAPSDAESSQWAERMARAAEYERGLMLDMLRRADVRYLLTRLKGVLGETVPLDDVPELMRPGVVAVERALNSLAVAVAALRPLLLEARGSSSYETDARRELHALYQQSVLPGLHELAGFVELGVVTKGGVTRLEYPDEYDTHIDIAVSADGVAITEVREPGRNGVVVAEFADPAVAVCYLWVLLGARGRRLHGYPMLRLPIARGDLPLGYSISDVDDDQERLHHGGSVLGVLQRSSSFADPAVTLASVSELGLHQTAAVFQNPRPLNQQVTSEQEK